MKPAPAPGRGAALCGNFQFEGVRVNNLAGRVKVALTAATLAIPQAAFAATPGAECLEIVIDEQRLDCFDQAVRNAVAREAGAAGAGPATPVASVALPARQSLLDRAWVVDPESRNTLVRLHYPNYALFGRYTTDVNNAPYQPLFDAFAEDGEFDSVEAKFQLSFKARLWASEERDAGVWFAYTQQNQWQVYNTDISSPFRETNYMPEVLVNFRPGVELGDWQLNLVNVGFNHQSNGRADPISRSWDRIFVEAGIERGDLALLAKAWTRVRLGDDEDDNPDITDYLGYGELTGIWKPGGHSFTASLRGNPATGKGAGQLTWMSPALWGPMKAYVQVFSGYGESMIDYDWNQTTFGVGVALNDRL
jgi:phospholipase A1